MLSVTNSIQDGMTRSVQRVSIVAIFLGLTLTTQSQAPHLNPHLEPAGENLLRLEGTDSGSGIHYLKFILLLRLPGTPVNATPDTLPRFTMECRELAGKHSLHWLLRFNGSPDFDFQPPILATKEQPLPPKNPTVDLKMRFEGYIRSQEFKRQWELLPTGELHYRNSGFYSANLDDPRYFLRWLASLPNLRIGYTKPAADRPKELIFRCSRCSTRSKRQISVSPDQKLMRDQLASDR
jgi:hypothetical protein